MRRRPVASGPGRGPALHLSTELGIHAVRTDKRSSARTGVLDSHEHGDGIRLVPGSDN